jgi:hypothetical protein
MTLLPPQFRDVGNVVANVMFFEALGFVVLGLVLWRWMRRRVPVSITRLGPEDANRMEQLQRSVDVIALEVERISEGQRYVTKVLNEALPALGSGAAQEVSMAQRDVQKVPRP